MAFPCSPQGQQNAEVTIPPARCCSQGGYSPVPEEGGDVSKYLSIPIPRRSRIRTGTRDPLVPKQELLLLTCAFFFLSPNRSLLLPSSFFQRYCWLLLPIPLLSRPPLSPPSSLFFIFSSTPSLFVFPIALTTPPTTSTSLCRQHTNLSGVSVKLFGHWSFLFLHILI